MNAAHANGSLRVLVVDDYRDAADSLGCLLRLWGYHARVAYEGATALETALRERPDLILLDLAMPGMDGLELARRLRAEPTLHGVVLVAITGLARPADRVKSEAAGIQYHLVKPVEPELLQRLLAKHATQLSPSD
jgi:CheY-like chemotaxis protein